MRGDRVSADTVKKLDKGGRHHEEIRVIKIEPKIKERFPFKGRGILSEMSGHEGCRMGLYK